MNDKPENNSEKEKQEELGLFDVLYDGLKDLVLLLQDIRFAAILLMLLAIATLIGTALPQTPMAQMAAEEITKAFGENVYLNFIKPAGFDNVFNTTWFRFLTILLVFSVTLCAWGRTKTAIALGKKRSSLTSEKGVKKLKFTSEESFDNKEDALNWVEKKLHSTGYKQSKEESGEEIHIFARKNLLSKWMLVVMHYSFVIILLGSIIGSLGAEAFNANVMEGETWKTEDGKAQIRLVDYWMVFDEKDFPDEMSYFTGQMPSDFKSKVEVLDKSGNILREKIIEVNHTLVHDGYKFYQTAWHYEPIFSVYKNNEKVDRFIIDKDQPFSLGDSGIVLFVPSQQVKSGKKLIHADDGSTSLEDIPPTCVLYTVNMSDRSMEGNTPITPVMQAGNGTGLFHLNDKIPFKVGEDLFEFQFEGMREYTILDVKRDPGVGIVFLGFLFCAVGASWGLLLPFATARAIVIKKSGKWKAIIGQTLPS